MAAVPYFKVVIGGKIGTTDTWSTGLAFRIDAGGVPTAADCNGVATAAAVLWVTDFWSHTSGGIAQLNPSTDFSFCRCYYYPGGSSVATVSGAATITPTPGLNSSNFIPPQCALVVSLKTGFTGRTNRGRSYLPAPPSLVAGGQVAASTVTNWTPLFAQFLTDMNSATTGAFNYTACIGTGLCPSITTISIDSVVDTQRRRRDKQIATANVSHAV